MFTVYVLYSVSHNKIYIGLTSNLIERFKSHNELGQKGWTKNFRPWAIVHKEIFDNKSSAQKREKELKSAKGREYIRNLIQMRDN